MNDKIAAAYEDMQNTRIADALEALNEPFHAGTRIINCMVHSGIKITERPADCPRCASDIRNHLSHAMRVNDFLNKKVEAARAALT